MNSKHILLPLLIILLIIAFFTIQNIRSKTITVGVIIPTETGLGYEEDLVFRYYRDKLLKEGEHRISIDIVNPSMDSSSLVAAYKEMEEKGADIIVGGEISKTGVILAQEADRSQLITFGVTASTHFLNNKKDNFYRLNPSTDALGGPFAEYIETQQKKRVAVIMDASNKPYSTALGESILQAYKGASLSLFYSDTESFIDSLKEFSPEAVVLILPSVKLGRCIKRIKELSSEIAIYSSDWGFGQLLALFKGKDLDNIYSLGRSSEPTPSYLPIIEAFEKSYQIDLTFAGIYALSIAELIVDVSRKNNYDIVKIKKHLNTPQNYTTGFGEIFMDAFGDSHHEFLYVLKIENNAIVSVQKIGQKKFRKYEQTSH